MQDIVAGDGRVPTNRTKRNILRSDNINSWQYGTSIQIIATLAALLHDLGKATVGFQHKLKQPQAKADPYRHEWISLQLFILMVEDCQNNAEVFTRLSDFNHYQQRNPNWHQKLASLNKAGKKLVDLPALAQWIGWLIVSHHRMPFSKVDQYWDKKKKEFVKPNLVRQKDDKDYIEDFTPKYFFAELDAFPGWVRNPLSEHNNPEQFWQLAHSVTTSQDWLKQLKRWANKALNHPNLMQLGQQTFISDPFLLYLSRLALMTGDHNFSSQPKQITEKVILDKQDQLIANTDSNRQPKQTLDEHLIGVASYTARFARLLPLISHELPTLPKHKRLSERTSVGRFMWQNRSFDLAKHYQNQANEAGFFGVNMASTGCGKTLANGRIMYALANPKRGARFTIALGLRVLTLQTGKALRERLQLDDSQLAILVGGKANQTLFELQLDHESKQVKDNLGSESEESLLDGWVDVVESGIDKAEFGTIIRDEKARQLLLTPLVTCTVDHLIQASENKRGGKHIAPALRLLSSDLILDEPDDFDQNDLPALARLVYLAGLFGSKVLLSSATLTPDLTAGLFNAYQAGRKIWQQQNQQPELAIVCGWFDEFNQQIEQVAIANNFTQIHQQFVQQRVAQLNKGTVRRQGLVMPLLEQPKKKTLDEENEGLSFSTLAQQLMEQAYTLHTCHGNIDPESNKKISVGLIRLAHTENVIKLARSLYQLKDLPQDSELHIVVYHAKQLLLLRSNLEEKLDRLLNRSDPLSLFNQPEIRQGLDHSSATEHLFIVIGTPVTEVGRDHDYDWAIIEPSSMRSIIQLVGRVWRHRPDKVATTPNVAILASNLTAIKQRDNLGINSDCFCRPGFESAKFRLSSHNTAELITQQQLDNINAVARIEMPTEMLSPANEKARTLAELEHRVMADLFNYPHIEDHKGKRKNNVVTSYWQSQLSHHYCVHLQLLTPFRARGRRQVEYICQYDPDLENGFRFNYAETAWQTPNQLCESSQNKTLRYQSWQKIIDSSVSVKPWLTIDFQQELLNLSTSFPERNLEYLALQFATVTLEDEAQWWYHPWFGFYNA